MTVESIVGRVIAWLAGRFWVRESRAEHVWVKRRPAVVGTAGSETRAELWVGTAATLRVPETRTELLTRTAGGKRRPTVRRTAAILQVPETRAVLRVRTAATHRVPESRAELRRTLRTRPPISDKLG